MNLKPNVIITLENNKKYVLLNETEYNNKKYFLAMEVNEKKEVIPDNVAIFENVVGEKETYIEKINDPKLIAILTEQLQTQI